MATTFLTLRSGMGPHSNIEELILRGLVSAPYVFLLSYTRPHLDGSNITEPTWPGYTSKILQVSTIGDLTINTTPVIYTTGIPPNTYYTIPYFAIINGAGDLLAAGSVAPEAYVGPSSTLTFGIGDILFVVPTVSFLPFTFNIAFPTVTYPTYIPTYEPAALSQPILYNRNMRS